MDKLRIGELYAKLKPRILELINTIGGGTGPFAPTPHGLNSPHHTGSLDDNQAPQFLKIDGTRDLIGNLNVANGIMIDGVDISALSAAYDAHLITDAHTIYAHAEGSGTRRAYEAGRLNRSILAGNGLTGGGLLTTDQTLSVLLNASWSGLSVDGNGLRINTAAAFTWTNDHVFQGLTKTRHLYPELTDTYDLGSSTLLWRKGWLSELDAILFSQNTVTLLGGWLLISKDEGAIDADVAPENTQVNFGKTMTVGDFVLFRAAGKVEYMQVGSLVSGTTYNVTRNLDGSGANSWPAGTPFAVLGQAGQGRIELNAFDTPRLQMIRQGATYNAQTEIIRIGDLNGNWGYTSQKWGVAIGEYASGKANITIDQDGIIRIRNYATDVIKLSGTDATIENVLKIAGTSSAIAIGNPPPTSSTAGTGLWLDRTGLYGLNANVRQAYFGSDGKLYAGGGNVRMESTGLVINHGELGENSIRWLDGVTEVVKMYSINTGGTNRTFILKVSGSTFIHIENPIGRSHFFGAISLGGSDGNFVSGLTGVYCQTTLRVNGALGVSDGITIGIGSSTYNPPSDNILCFVNVSNPSVVLDGFVNYGIYSYNSILYGTKNGGTLKYPIEPVRQINLGVQAWVAPPSGGASRGAVNNYEYWAFPDASITIIDTILPCPIGTIDGARQFTLSIWFNNTTNTGNVFVFFEVRVINNGTYVPSAGVVASGSATIAVPSTANQITKYSFASFTLSNAIGAYEGQALQIRLYRYGSHANDTNAGEMRLFAGELRLS